MIIKRFVIIFIITLLLISGQVFAVEKQKTISKADFEEIEDYLNRILDFHEETLRKIVKNLPKDKRDWYAPLHDDYQVVIEPFDEIFAIIDVTTKSSQKYIHISKGYLWTRIMVKGRIINWELKSEAELAGILAHELGHLVSIKGRDVATYEKEYVKKEVMVDVFAVDLLLEEGYCSLAVVDPLERYSETCYDYFKHFVSKRTFQERIRLVKERVLEALAKSPSSECKEFIIATKEEFEKMKELLKSGK